LCNAQPSSKPDVQLLGNPVLWFLGVIACLVCRHHGLQLPMDQIIAAERELLALHLGVVGALFVWLGGKALR
jgi:hypothetical protein